MRPYRFCLILIASLCFYIAPAQVTKIPPTAKENFSKQYPTATDEVWYNDILEVNVRFA